MKRKNLDRFRRVVVKDAEDSYHQTLDGLEHAWNNLPEDISQDERVMFFELAEKVLRQYQRNKSSDSN